MEIKFVQKLKETPQIWSFFFTQPAGFSFEAGDYVELAIPGVDRRWLTITSAPSEKHLQFTTKLSDSKFKQALSQLEVGNHAVISPAIGSFNLPQTEQNLIFVAGGLGITPYRSMLAEMAAQKIGFKSDFNLIYAAQSNEHLFEDLINKSSVHYRKLTRRPTLNDITAIPNWESAIIYLAGPQNLCEELYRQLLAQGLNRPQLKLCYFPGYSAY